MRDKRWNRLERGGWGLLPSLLLCSFAGGAGLQEKREREL